MFSKQHKIVAANNNCSSKYPMFYLSPLFLPHIPLVYKIEKNHEIISNYDNSNKDDHNQLKHNLYWSKSVNSDCCRLT